MNSSPNPERWFNADGEATIWHHAIIEDRVSIGNNSVIGSCVFVGRGARIGKNVHIQHGAFIARYSIIEDDVFIGPNAMLIDDKYPRAGSMYSPVPPILRKGCSVGAGAVIMPGVVLGEDSMVGAGAVVTTNVPARLTVVGTPARVFGDVISCEAD